VSALTADQRAANPNLPDSGRFANQPVGFELGVTAKYSLTPTSLSTWPSILTLPRSKLTRPSSPQINASRSSLKRSALLFRGHRYLSDAADGGAHAFDRRSRRGGKALRQARQEHFRSAVGE
jgi:hypothetical protein